ncbi:MAG: DUF4347 domain-containing protein, partial [Magnetococcus sp. DMHC-8]
MLFDGAGVVGAQHTDPPLPEPIPDPPLPPALEPSQDKDAANPAPWPAARQEVAFVDQRITDWSTLVAALRPGIEVVCLDDTDGVAQMADWARTHAQYDAIHLLSHGAPGRVTVGTTTLTTDNLADHAADLATIGAALTTAGDLLLYGCQVAQGVDGAALVTQLAEWTRAEVAASTNATGATPLGGDWLLETHAGPIETIAIDTASWSGLLGTPGISNLSHSTYVEQNPAYILDNNVSFAGGTSYSGGYLEFSLNAANTADRLTLATDGVASATTGQISILNNTVYLGNGTNAAVVGSVDGTYNGLNGQKLRINFSGQFENGNFNTGAAGNTSFAGWTAVKSQVRFGTDTIAGLNTPTDNAWPTNKPGGGYTDQHVPTTLGTLAVALNTNQNDGTGYSVKLSSTGMTTQAGYDIVRGPSIYSNNAVPLEVNDQVSFEWMASGGSDAYDVYCYIVDINNGHIETLLNQTGSSASASTNWATVTTSVTQAGEYRFVFVSGTYDFTGGKGAGAQLFIDDVTVTQAHPAFVNDTYLATIAQRVQFSNTADDPSPSKTLTVTAKSADGSTGSATATITITPVNDAPVATAGATLAYTENGAAAAIDNTITLSDVDDTQIAGATVTISSGLTGGDSLAVATQNGIVGTYNATLGRLTLTGTATLANYQTALRSVTFVSSSDAPTATAATRTITWAVTDANSDGAGAQTSADVTSTVNVTPLNDAPVLATATPTLTGILESDTSNAGQLVSDFLTGVTDADGAGALSGIALYGTNSGNGSWEYNTGSGWTALGAVSTTQALLLRTSDAIRLVPNGTSGTTASISYYAWDQTSGSQGNKVNVSSRGSSTAFSTNGNTANITVTAVNDAPVLTVAAPTLTTILETDTNNAGQLVSSFLTNATDPDGAGSLSGIALHSLDSGIGTWQYNTGSGWTAMGTVSATQALLLRSSDSVRFIPDHNGTTATISYYAWDQTTGSPGNKVSVAGRGGSTAFSLVDNTATLTVTAINDAPLLDTGKLNGLAGITEDDVTNAGQTVASLVQGGVGNAITDLDLNAATGIAITATGTAVGAGYWEYSTDGGTTWSGLGAVSTGAARLLLATDKLRYHPDQWVGGTTTLTFCAWDQTSGVARATADTTANGGTTAFSGNSGTVQITVSGINDAPIVTGSGGGVGYGELGADTAIDTALTLTEDSGLLTQAVVRIAAGFTAGDTLTFVNQNNIAGSYNAATGVLTLSGSDSVTHYQTALASITFSSSSHDPTLVSTMRTLTWQVTDNDNTPGTTVTRTLTITPVADPPSLTGAPTAWNYTEDDGARVVASALLLDDLDDRNLVSAAVTLDTGAAGFSATDEYLAILNTGAMTFNGGPPWTTWTATVNGIGLTYTRATGNLSATGAADLATWQALLRTVTYQNGQDYSLAADLAGRENRAITWQVTDANSDGTGSTTSTLATTAITLLNDNEVPQVANAGGTVAYTEQATPATLGAALTVTGNGVVPDILSRATVTITAGLANDDLLTAITAGTGITASYDASTGTLTLSGPDLTSSYQTVLRSVTFSSGTDPTAGNTDRTVIWQIFDPTNVASAVTGGSSTTVRITPVNDAPRFATLPGNGTVVWLEGSTGVNPAAALTLVDVDDSQLTQAQMVLSGAGLVATREYLAIDNVTAGSGSMAANSNWTATNIDNTGIAAAYQAATGTLTLSGTASLTAYRDILRRVLYRSSDDDPTAVATTRTLTWSVTDANSDGVGARTGSATSTVTLQPSNNAPTLTDLPGQAVSYTEGATGTVLASGLTLTDADDTWMSAATVSISAGFTSGDTLAVGRSLSGTGITASYDATTGQLLLTGSASQAQYMTLLQSVTFASSSDDPTAIAAVRSIDWRSTDANSDGAGPQTSAVFTQQVTITPTGDTPVITPGTTTSYTEGSALTLIQGNLTLTDADDLQLTGGTVTISTGLTSGDLLNLPTSFASSSGISAAFANGVLTLSGTATVAQYQAALRAIGFQNDSSDPTNHGLATSRTLTWAFRDANSDGVGVQTGSNTSTLLIVATNDAPVVAAGATLAYSEQEAAAVIDSTVSLSDVDSSQITGATVNISSGYTDGDLLAFASQSGITGTYDATTHQLTLNGTASIAQYQAALRAVTFSSTSDNPTAISATRTITWMVTDASATGAGGQTSTGVTSSIIVTAINDAPVLDASRVTPFTAITEDDITQTGQTVAALVQGSAGLAMTDVDLSAATGIAITATGTEVGDGYW